LSHVWLGLKGSGGRGGHPGELWDLLQALVWCRLVVGIPAVVGPAARPRSGYSSMVWPVQLRDGSRTELWPGTARGAESLAEWSSGSADLLGRDLAGLLFLY
jgi:hypothetical protein